jgi:hypothetical protein
VPPANIEDQGAPVAATTFIENGQAATVADVGGPNAAAVFISVHLFSDKVSSGYDIHSLVAVSFPSGPSKRRAHSSAVNNRALLGRTGDFGIVTRGGNAGGIPVIRVAPGISCPATCPTTVGNGTGCQAKQRNKRN